MIKKDKGDITDGDVARTMQAIFAAVMEDGGKCGRFGRKWRAGREGEGIGRGSKCVEKSGVGLWVKVEVVVAREESRFALYFGSLG